MNFQRPIVAKFSKQNLQHNALLVKNKFAKNSKFFAVIKANAYGHGQLFAVEALKNIADGFALLECENAVLLRENNLINANQKIILLEGIFSAKQAKQVLDCNIISAVHCVEQFQWLLEQFQKNQKNSQVLEIAIKLNTGMNRLGFTQQNFANALNLLANPDFASALKNQKIKITLMTHFATADENLPNKGIHKAITNFQNLEKIFQQKFPNLAYQKCLANSAAICDFPSVHYDWVRPGIMLYGSSPFGLQNNKTAADLDLKPVMTLQSKIIAIQHLKAGDCVGYGETFIAKKDMKIGVVACGYADGYLRSTPSGTPLMVNNQKTKSVGRISMDMLCCDLTDISGEVGIGTPVTLWGDGIAGSLPIDEVAEFGGTISYELMCSLANRVKREIID